MAAYPKLNKFTIWWYYGHLISETQQKKLDTLIRRTHVTYNTGRGGAVLMLILM